MRKPPAATALLALAAAMFTTATLITGCSAPPGPSQVASLPGHAGASTAGRPVLTQSQSDQDMVDFTRCMRQHGVAMPDPAHRPGHAGLSIELPTQDGATRAAYSACNHFMQPIYQQKEAGAISQASPLLPALTRYAECMRGHDINMLDPEPDGAVNLGQVPGISTDFGRYSPQFRAADSACRHLLPRSVHDDGSGP